MGTISASRRPAAWAAAVRCCDCRAYSSWASRRDAVALGHHLGGLQHRHVDVGRQLEQRLVLHAVEVHVLVLDQRDALQPAADGHLLAVDDDLFGRRGDGHEARGALAVDAHARDAGGQAGGQRYLTGDVGRGGALLQGRAHDHVLDFGRIDARALDRMAHRMGAQLLRLGVVEGAAIGPADGGAGGGDDDGFAGHGTPLNGSGSVTGVEHGKAFRANGKHLPSRPPEEFFRGCGTGVRFDGSPMENQTANGRSDGEIDDPDPLRHSQLRHGQEGPRLA